MQKRYPNWEVKVLTDGRSMQYVKPTKGQYTKYTKNYKSVRKGPTMQRRNIGRMEFSEKEASMGNIREKMHSLTNRDPQNQNNGIYHFILNRGAKIKKSHGTETLIQPLWRGATKYEYILEVNHYFTSTRYIEHLTHVHEKICISFLILA